MIVQCCVCKRVRKGCKWGFITIPQGLKVGISHGYCPACAAKAFEEIRKVSAMAHA